MITAAPALTPLTNPVVLIDATEGLELVHVPPTAPLLENWLLLPTQIGVAPLSWPAFGGAVIVMVRVATAVGQPPEPTTV